MKISWNDVRQIERYLNNTLREEGKRLFEAELAANPLLRLNVGMRKKIHVLIRLYGRKKTREDIEKIECKLFQNRENVVFQHRIYQLFEDN